MSLKKIKRAEKKGTESVMDEKFALLFWSEFSIGNGEFHYQVSWRGWETLQRKLNLFPTKITHFFLFENVEPKTNNKTKTSVSGLCSLSSSCGDSPWEPGAPRLGNHPLGQRLR